MIQEGCDDHERAHHDRARRVRGRDAEQHDGEEDDLPPTSRASKEQPERHDHERHEHDRERRAETVPIGWIEPDRGNRKGARSDKAGAVAPQRCGGRVHAQHRQRGENSNAGRQRPRRDAVEHEDAAVERSDSRGSAKILSSSAACGSSIRRCPWVATSSEHRGGSGPNPSGAPGTGTRCPRTRRARTPRWPRGRAARGARAEASAPGCLAEPFSRRPTRAPAARRRGHDEGDGGAAEPDAEERRGRQEGRKRGGGNAGTTAVRTEAHGRGSAGRYGTSTTPHAATSSAVAPMYGPPTSALGQSSSATSATARTAGRCRQRRA